MDYEKHYNLLIEKARNRVLDGYVERHHVIPKCMGGSNDNCNLVALTPEEHFVAHQLLIKMFPHEYKLVFAANMMCKGGKRSNKMYGWLRRRMINALKYAPRKIRKKETKPRPKRTLTEEHRQKIGIRQKGRIHSPDAIKKMKESNRRTAIEGRRKSQQPDYVNPNKLIMRFPDHIIISLKDEFENISSNQWSKELSSKYNIPVRQIRGLFYSLGFKSPFTPR